MKYFTKQLWLDAQDPGLRESSDRAWSEASEAYAQQLESLRGRLDESSFSFFEDADIHDGRLVSINVHDGDHVTYVGEDPIFSANPVSASLVIQNHDRTLQWSLTYAGVRRTLIDFPSDQPAFHSEGEGFGDIGYDELTEAGQTFLRHELLFSSGACILVEFQSLGVRTQVV